MGKLLTILSSVTLLATSFSAYSSTADQNALQYRLLDADQYITSLVERTKVMIRDHNGQDLPAVDDVKGKDNPYFSTLKISKKYEILLQFSSKKSTSSNAKNAAQGADAQFNNRRIMLIPIFANSMNADAEDVGTRSWVPTSWNCLTDIQKFNDDLLELNTYLGVKSPVSGISSNKYLSGCTALSPEKLNPYWEENQK